MARKQETDQAVSILGTAGLSLPQINPEHAAFLKANPPDDFHEEVGHQDYELVRIKLDAKTFETVALYELAVPDEYQDYVTVYTCEVRIRDNRPVRTDRKPIEMEWDRFNKLR